MADFELLQFKSMTRFLKTADKASGASTTLSANAAKAATSLVVASSAGFVAGKAFRVGAGRSMTVYVVDSIPDGTHIAIVAPGLKRAYLSGEVVVEQTVDRHGPLTDTGTEVRISRESTDVFSAEQRLIFAKRRGYGAIRFQGTIDALTMRALALGLGIDKTKILGANSTADPLQIVSDGNEFGTDKNGALI